MNIIFKKLILKNFMSFADAEIDLDNQGVVFVEGKNNCIKDLALSNGSGKSSLFNGICYALTGETILGLSIGLENIYSDGSGCFVQLEFYLNDKLVLIERGQTKPNQYRNFLKVYVDGEDISGKTLTETNEALKNLMPGFDTQFIGSLLILGQGLPYKFAANSPGNRRKVLESLTKSDYIIETVIQILSTRRESLDNLLRTAQDKYLTTNTNLKLYQEQIIPKERLILNSLNIKDLTKKLNTLNKDISKTMEKIDSIKIKLINLNKDKTGLDDKRFVLYENNQKELQKELGELNAQKDAITKNLLDIASKKKFLQNEIKKIETIPDTCPTCKRPYDNFERPSTKDLKEELIILDENKTELEKEENEIIAKTNSVKEKKEKEYEEQSVDLREKINKKNKQIEEAQEQLNELNNKKAELDKQKFTVNKDIDAYNIAKENLKESLKKVEEYNTELVSLKTDVTLLQDRIQCVKNIASLVSSKFRGILLYNVVEHLNRILFELSKYVYKDQTVKLILEDRSIVIKIDEKQYENLSGGERQKLDILTQLAIRTLLSQYLNVKSNLLVCDEVFDNLDVVATNHMSNLIVNISDVTSNFVISHHDLELDLSYDKKILITKNEPGISELMYN